MNPVVMSDKDDHWSVIADYSGSPRHSAMSQEEWEAEFNGEEYSAMKGSHPGSIAAVIPVGVGKWKKDWSGPYLAPVPKIFLSSYAPIDFDGIPAINSGTEKHIILIQAMSEGAVIKSSAPLQVMVTAPIPVDSFTPTLSEGKAFIQVGPCPTGCDLKVTVADPEGKIALGSMRIRFKGRQADPVPVESDKRSRFSAVEPNLVATPPPPPPPPEERPATTREPSKRFRWWPSRR